jgi:hypothetical protein
VNTFTVTETERRQFKSGKREGQWYLRVKAPGVGWASVFDKTDAELILASNGGTFKGEIEEDDYGKKIAKVELASEQEAQAQTAERMSKDDWQRKDDLDAVRRLYITHITNLTHFAEAAVPKEVGWNTYEQIRSKAREYANQDFLWIQSGNATEVPF